MTEVGRALLRRQDLDAALLQPGVDVVFEPDGLTCGEFYKWWQPLRVPNRVIRNRVGLQVQQFRQLLGIKGCFGHDNQHSLNCGPLGPPLNSRDGLSHLSAARACLGSGRFGRTLGALPPEKQGLVRDFHTDN